MVNNEFPQQFERDGFYVFENFLAPDEVGRLRQAGESFPRTMPKDERKTVFQTSSAPQNKENYFLESGNKIRFFYEAEALNENGELQVPIEVCLNKVGHALHQLHEDFKEITFSEKIKQICRQLKFERPAILQSMYIYKNPGIGSEVVSHQDATFLYTDPDSLVGLWFPLDDATLENGCLWFIPGSHKSGLHRRYLRNADPEATELLKFDGPPLSVNDSEFIPCPVKKGSCVVINGRVIHKSEQNKSGLPRHAYTFHLYDSKLSTYSEENWLQTPDGFQTLY